MKNIFNNWIFAFAITIFIQTFLINYIQIDSIKPDIIIILLIYYTLINGSFRGIVLAFFIGLLFDFVSVGVIGSSSFSKVIAIFFTGYFYNENRKELILENFYFVFVVFLISFIDGIIYSMITNNTEIINITNVFFRFGLFPAIYTSVISTFIYLKSPKITFTYGK